MTAMTLEDNIHHLMGLLGITRNYRGYNVLVCAAELAVAEPDRLQLVTKSVYPDVAKCLGMRPAAVERNIRTVVSLVWDNNRKSFCWLTGSPIPPEKPTSGQFLSMVVAYLQYHAQQAVNQ